MTPEAKEAEVDTGRLLVYAPRILEAAPADSEVPPRALHSGYTVYEEGGLKVAHETNHGGVLAEGPVELKLAPGRYFVRLDEPVHGPRDFWVTVKQAQVTRVEIEGGYGAPSTVR